VSSGTSNLKLDPNEPPTKLIKLINGSAILAPMDKDNKMLHSGQLTLQQVMVIKLWKLGNGAFNEFLIAGRWRRWLSCESYSALDLVARIQGHRTTAKRCHYHWAQHATQWVFKPFWFQKRILIKCLLLVNGHPTGGLQHRPHHLQSHSQPGNLQKLLMNGNGVTSSTSANISTISIPAISQHGINGSRLAPGGAELNLLPSSTTPNGAIYRNQGKLAIVKGESINHFQEQVNNRCFLHNSAEMNNSNRVHVMQSTPTIVVSQPQNINIITSSPQLTGKVCFS
jgi:hypothetical protein